MTTYIATDTQFDFAPRPGRILQRELDARAISQAQLAARTGLSPKHINLVIKGTAALSPDVAVTLEEILGVSADTWLHLEAAHQAYGARKERRNALAGFVEWANSFPRQLLIDRKVIDKNDSGPDAVAKLLRFFEVASPTAYGKTWLEPQASYKRSQIHSIDPNLTALWLRLSELHAAGLIANAPTYDSTKLRAAAALLPKLTVNDDVGKAFTKAQELLLDAGVVLVFVPEVPNTRISGVSRWVNGTPMIAVTSRYKALDSLWFTLLHEIAHVALHPKRSTFIDEFKADDDADAQETAANAFAEDHLIPRAYRAQLAAIATVNGIVSLANVLGVSPSLVAGQWAFRTKTWGGPIAKLRRKFDLAELL
ncbi:ImmA/IrrE family metallo-endopeptidase (plasmid) [Pseudarthrobacter psychrotolerans]|uniref:ImmA/IrrE family metallo-endopeptidase n=1 Tax=Pseudarthrobacter psychrotolerans TaxID=2697569 RepID=A0A6P1NY81_9MICC|nr:ImmA/IrrE family metallo-endopeptidase [Pseudarthrobacter psychrotolerans]QHK22592.1 ImmA/IrrE family metallo-endopeptidase [Pseudarthrobacter psychrotolerans]